MYEVTSSSLNPLKSSGVDDIPTELMKAAKHVLCPYLSTLKNYCLKNGRYFEALKIARVMPFTKEASTN